jgi:hypothetical protein
MSSPRTGVGACSSGNITALTEGGSADVNGSVVQLPQALNYETPALPSPMPPTTNVSSGLAFCISFNLAQAPATCDYSSGKTTIDPKGATVELGNISGNWVLKGGDYSINSIGSGDLAVQDSSTGTHNVVINLTGKTSAGGDIATPFNLNGNAVVNTSMDPTRLQVLYAGTGSIDLTGGSTAAMMLYAPNASVTTHGNADIWGSVLAKQITSAGTPRFVYDRRLQSTFKTLGNYMLPSFSWKKY